MKRTDNYAIQAQQAKRWFLTYDQDRLIRKYQLKADGSYLYTQLFRRTYRIHRFTGDLEKLVDGLWADGNSHHEVMTLFDLLCDAKEDRSVSGKWKSMQNFGLMFHQGMLEERKNPWAARFDTDPELLHRGCRALGGVSIPGCDIGYAIEIFDGLPIAIQFWHGDEDFAPRLRYLWDENADQYIRYETMWFAVNLLLERIMEG